jgi:hypothetical protein
MPFVLLIVGLLMIITGARGTYAQFGSQLASEFEGTNSFTYQMIALGAIGALGYIPALQTISRWALALILLVILLSNKGSNGFFSEFQAALQNGPTTPQPIGTAAAPTPAQLATASQTSGSNSSIAASLGLPGGSGGFWNFIGLPSIGNYLGYGQPTTAGQ